MAIANSKVQNWLGWDEGTGEDPTLLISCLSYLGKMIIKVVTFVDLVEKLGMLYAYGGLIR